MRVKELRLARGWSQAQLAERSGLSVRTVQRIEGGANPGLESLALLAAVFDVSVSDLQAGLPESRAGMSFQEAVVHCVRHYADFSGVADRAEFWWFALAVTLALALAQSVGGAVGPWLATSVAVLALLPFLAAATRRLRDAGQSPWWLLILLAPVGGLVAVAFLLAMPSRAGENDRLQPAVGGSGNPSARVPGDLSTGR